VIDLSPGAPMATGRSMDIMVNGTGVLGVQAQDGSLAFTRRGDMTTTPEGLVTLGDGSLVLEASGAPLAVPPGSTLSFGPDGAVYASDVTQQGQAPVQIGQLFLRDAANADLVRRVDGLFTPVAGNATATGDISTSNAAVSITPGALEASNASAMEAMVRMIDLSRSFETNIRIMRETKDLDQQGASMMRLA
jgi:Flagellar basal body rod protein